MALRLGMMRARLLSVRQRSASGKRSIHAGFNRVKMRHRDLGLTKKQLASSSIRCHFRIDNFVLADNHCAIQPELHKSGPLQAGIIKNKNKLRSED